MKGAESMKNRLFATAAAASVLAVAAAPALLVRCGGQSALVGRWAGQSNNLGHVPDSMELLSDGRGVLDGNIGCTWKVGGGRLYIFRNDSSNALACDYSLSGTTLTLTIVAGNDMKMAMFAKLKK
jgi:hypothetical protein